MGCGRNNKVDNTGTVSSYSNDSGGEGTIMITGLHRGEAIRSFTFAVQTFSRRLSRRDFEQTREQVPV